MMIMRTMMMINVTLLKSNWLMLRINGHRICEVKIALTVNILHSTVFSSVLPSIVPFNGISSQMDYAPTV